MNAFASYGDTAAPVRAAPRAKREPSALDLKLQEKQRLSRAYKAMRRRDRAEALQQEPRLRDFMRWLGRQGDPVELVTGIAESWLPTSPQNIRFFALERVSRHCDRLNRAAGFEALDDPIPPETSVYFRCRELLHKGGRG